eukprot:5307869-Amphidinium_carterae.1
MVSVLVRNLDDALDKAPSSASDVFSQVPPSRSVCIRPNVTSLSRAAELVAVLKGYRAHVELRVGPGHLPPCTLEAAVVANM